MFDDLDLLLIQELQRDARISISQLARQLGHPIPTIRDRIKRLERNGVITGYKAVIDPVKIGFSLKALIQISVDVAVRSSEEFLNELGKVVEVESAFLVSGEFEAVILVHARSVEDLRRIVYDEIPRIPGVSGTNTMLVFSDSHWEVPR